MPAGIAQVLNRARLPPILAKIFSLFLPDCAFEIHSSITPNGTISSPNFPGLYPKNTVCNYNFIGGRNKKLRLRFITFDIEGVPM